MSDSVLQVEVVAADQLVWSGEATMVITRTSEGEIGVLANHSPLLSVMVHGYVDIRSADGESAVAAVDDGFISVAANRVSILASRAMLADQVDLEKRRSDLEGLEGDGSDDEPEQAAERAWLEAQVRAAEYAS